MKVGIVGSRRRDTLENKLLIESELKKIKVTEIVSGGCKRGADRIAEEIASERDIPIKLFLPQFVRNMNYNERVKSYYVRNKQIAEYSDILICVVSTDRKGGTENTIKHAKKFGTPMVLI